MKTTTRESEIWSRSAAKHARDGEPVAAAFAAHLAEMAQNERDEFETVKACAEVLHAAAILAKQSA
jgi:hypothetical protein